jgi:hypothetical protein
MISKGLECCAAFDLFVVLSLGFAVFGVARGQDRDDDLGLRERFLSEAPLRWEEYSQRIKNVQGSFSFKYFYALGDLRGETSFQFKMNPKAMLINISRESATAGKLDKMIAVFGANPSYAFGLQRKDTASPWIVTQLVDVRNGSLPSGIPPYFEDYQRGINDLMRLFTETLPEVTRNPQFHLLRCRKVFRGDEELVEVLFDYSHDPGQTGNPIQRGTLLLDAQRFWSLRSYEAESKGADFTGTIKHEVLELGQTEQSLPVPKRAVELGESVDKAGNRNKREFHFSYDLHEPRRLPSDEEFTLSAFGLPEPGGGQWPKRSIPIFVWVALAGAICLVVGTVFGIARKRLAKSASPS